MLGDLTDFARVLTHRSVFDAVWERTDGRPFQLRSETSGELGEDLGSDEDPSRSGVIFQTCYRSGGVVSLLSAHLSSTTGNGTLNSDPMTFALAVSGNDVFLRITNGSSTNNRTVNLAVRWSRQHGGNTA